MNFVASSKAKHVVMGETAEQKILTVRRYIFREKENDKNDLRVCIPEVLDSQYGMYVWPCAVVLAQYVWFRREIVAGKKLLELGAGVSLPGVVAAKCGAKVTLSDSADLPECLENCRRSCQMNNLQGVKVFGFTWGDISPELLTHPPVDIILGSDVFYDPEDFEDILSSVSFLLEKNVSAEFWTTYQVRSTDWSIEDLLHKWDMKCFYVPLKSFAADRPHLAGSDLPGRHTVQMIILTLAKNTGTKMMALHIQGQGTIE